MLPNAIAMLSVFAFLCEAWLGVKSYLDLWRYFYSGMYHVGLDKILVAHQLARLVFGSARLILTFS